MKKILIGCILILTSFLPAQEVLLKKPALTWLGHGYFLINTATGIRIAIDPFDRNLFHYELPATIESDIILVTHESNEANAVEQVGGSPQIYRSATGLGLNVANGLPFLGTRSQRKNGASNVVFSFRIGKIKIAHLGVLGSKLTSSDLESIGTVDIVIAPVGHPLALSFEEQIEVARALNAKVLIPAFYATEYSSNFRLTPLDDLLKNQSLPVKEFDSNSLPLSAPWPKSLQIWVLKSPMGAKKEANAPPVKGE